MLPAPRFLEQRVNKRRGFGATKNDQCADQQEHDNDRRYEVGLVRHDEIEQLGDEGTTAHGVLLRVVTLQQGEMFVFSLDRSSVEKGAGSDDQISRRNWCSICAAGTR